MTRRWRRSPSARRPRWATCRELPASAARSWRNTAATCCGPCNDPLLLQEPDGARVAHLGLDAVLGLQLLHEFFGAELGRENVGLALHGREIARAQLLQRRQARAQRGSQERGVAGQRLDDEHGFALRPGQRIEPDLEGEA